MRRVVESIAGEFLRYKALAEGAVDQLDSEQLAEESNGGNSVAVLLNHLAGNLTSRFTDFLTSDGEKPWRERDAEFLPPGIERDALMGRWELGWNVLLTALDGLSDQHLSQEVTIRGQTLSVIEALHRSLGHASYHVGQIVFLARSKRGDSWEFLSIPPGKTAEYNRQPTLEKGPKPGRPA